MRWESVVVQVRNCLRWEGAYCNLESLDVKQCHGYKKKVQDFHHESWSQYIWFWGITLSSSVFNIFLLLLWETTRPCRYDLNQIPYDYTVKVRKRFKALDLIDRGPDELWMEVRDIVQEIGIETNPKKKKCKKVKWPSEEALQIAVNRREVKGKGEKER